MLREKVDWNLGYRIWNVECGIEGAPCLSLVVLHEGRRVKSITFIYLRPPNLLEEAY